MGPLDVLVHFGPDVPDSVQGPALLALEKHLRSLARMDCRVFKEKMRDDSKLRIKMTQVEREGL